MKRVHNVRILISHPDEQAAGAIANRILTDAGVTLEQVDLRTEEDDGAHVREIWADRQPPVRKLTSLLIANLSEANRREIVGRASAYIDTSTHCFLRLDTDALLEGTYALTAHPDSIRFRLNIAAFPATKENAVKIVEDLFSSTSA